MTAFDRSEDQSSLRRCAVTGAVLPKDSLLRFAVTPDGGISPDISGKLPGRGVWLTPRRDLVVKACRKNVFARSARRPVRIEPDLPDRVAMLMRQRSLQLLGLAKRGGLLTVGFEKVRGSLRSGKCAVLVQASDAAEDGRRKLRRLAAALKPPVPVVELFDVEALQGAVGRSNTVHIAVASGGIADRFMAECERLRNMMPDDELSPSGDAPSEASISQR